MKYINYAKSVAESAMGARRTAIASAAITLAIAGTAFAQTAAISNLAGTPAADVLPEIKVRGKAPYNHDKTLPGSDAAQLFNDIPGYHAAAGGGVSGLPTMNGFADDRLKIRIDGLESTSACANHMNAPLSYIDPKQVGSISLIAGIAPVSAGGDNIGGTIEVRSAAPLFAEPGAGLLTTGSLSLTGRSVDNGVSTAVSATVASDSLSLNYTGTHAQAHSYRDGNGNKVLGSMFESNNQAVALAAQGDGQQLVLRAGQQHIPYQGFPNEYMDMTDNRAVFANLTHTGRFSWGALESKIYWQNTYHEMGFFSTERPGTMPMNTHGRDLGYAVKADIVLREDATLRLGNEYHGFRLDDVWPAVPGSMMMGPQPYVNVNGGKRDRMALFAELENNWGGRWSTVVGVRDEIVSMDTGNVQPYAVNMMNAADAAAAGIFNARDRARRDNNIDLTALARYTPDASGAYEFGYARKTRSPNLYERYSWGRGVMAMTMTNWFGDGNGYVGNMDLKPEVAHTLGATAEWHSDDNGGNDGGDSKRWFVKVNPYYSYVQNYIDTDIVGTFTPSAGSSGNLLQFANHDAWLYGVNLSWQVPVYADTARGEISFNGNASVTRGKRTGGGDLYHMMPLNALLRLQQSKGAWTNTLEARLFTRKDRIDAQRLEPVTGGYALLGLRTVFLWTRDISVTAGISNLLNKSYADPLGGVYLSGRQANGGDLQALPGYGRSFDVGLTMKF